jgi:hypothetical protein
MGHATARCFVADGNTQALRQTIAGNTAHKDAL